MTTLKKTILSVAFALAAVAASAATGHIYDIRPWDSVNNKVLTGPIKSVTDPMVGGDAARFTLRFACTVDHRTDDDYKWYLDYIGIGSIEVAKLYHPLKVGIFVSGELREATLVDGGIASSDKDYTDFIFEYVARPGDFQLPIVLALADGTPASGFAGEDVSYYVPSDSKSYWSVRNTVGETANFWVGEWSIKPEGAEEAAKDYDLRQAGFYVKTVDFDDKWETEKTKSDPGLWRSVHEGSATIKGKTESEAGDEPTLTLVAAATNSVTLHVWSDNSAAVVVTNKDESLWYDVVMKLNQTGSLLATNRVLDVKVQAGQTEIPFEIFGVKSNETANLVLSATTNYTYDSTGTRYDDYVTVPVKCVGRKTKSRYVKASVDGGLEVVNVSTNYEEAVGSLTVAVATGYTNDVTVTVTPRLRDGAGAWSNYVHIAGSTSLGMWATTDPFTYTIPKSEIASEAVDELHKTIYIFAMGADNHTALAAGGIVFDVTLDDESAAYYGKPQSDSILYFKPTAPVITQPTEGEELEANGGITREFDIAVSDSYKNINDRATGYKVYIKKESSEKVTELEGAYAPDEDGILFKIGTDGSLTSVKPSITYEYKGTFQSELYVLAPDSKTKSAVRKFTMKVSEPARIEAYTDLNASNATNEGAIATVYVKLSQPNKTGNVIYAYLLPIDEDSSNKVQSTCLTTATSTKGLKINKGADTSALGTLLFLDGASSKLGGSALEYELVLCTSSKYDATKRVEGFESENLTLTIFNVEPKVNEVRMNTVDSVSENNGWMSGTVSKGVEKTFTFDIDEPGINDLTAEGDEMFQLQYAVKEDGGASTNAILYGNANTNSFKYTFKKEGEATVTVELMDKDMKAYPGKFGGKFTFKVNVTDLPRVWVESDSGSFRFSEDATGIRNTKMTVKVTENTSSENLKFAVAVTPKFSDAANPGTLKLEGGTPTSTNANVYVIDFTPGQTEATFYIDEADGTKLSLAKGYALQASCITTSLNPDGKRWCDVFIPESAEILTLENTDPTITCELGEPTTNSFIAAVGNYDTLWFMVDDISYDLGAEGSTTNLTVVWKSEGANLTTNCCSSTNTYYFTPRFNSSGPKVVTVTVTDKDGGRVQKSWNFTVQSSKTLVATPVGPANGASTLADRYSALAGRGEGHIWVSGATFSGMEMFDQTWNCGLAGNVSAYAWGYKVGAIDNGKLNSTSRFAHDIPVGPSGSNNTDGKRALGTDSDSDYYNYKGDKDSFLYLWVKYGVAETTTSTGSSSSTTTEDAESVGKIAMEKWDGSSTTTPSVYVPSLPKEADENGGYSETHIEAIFSKEYLVSDNMGDINQDGLPDLYVKKYLFGVFDETTGEITGSDIIRRDNYNDDGDYLPGKSSSVYSYFVPSSTNTVAISSGSPFTAVQELRGGYPGITGEWSGLNDACDSTYVGISGVAVTNIWENPAENRDATLTELEYAAWVKLGKPSVTDWSPECPTDPTVWDTDSDNLSDAYEYYYWYRAHVGYFDQGTTNHHFMTGRRYNPKQPCIPDEITSKMIEDAMNPTVYGSHDENDTDNDGLSDLEESALGTNPFDFDTDGDGLPDGYEVVISGTNPVGLEADGTRNADGDAMACRDLTDWYVIPVTNNCFLCSPEKIETVEMDGLLYVSATNDQAIYTAWLYSGTEKSGVYCRGRQFYATETYQGNPDYAVVGEAAKHTVRIAHFHVYQMFPFDPRTGWNTETYYTGHSLDTLPFTARDEFLLQAFFYNAGGLEDADLVATVDKPMTTLWLQQTTCPILHPLEKTDEEGAYAANEDVFGADTDADGMPDGWELYLMAGPETKPAKPTKATDLAIKDLCRPKSYYSPLFDYALVPTSPTNYQNVNASDNKALNADSLLWPEEFSGVESCAVYSNCTTIVNVHPEWKNKWWPTDPWNKDTDGDGLSDSEELSYFVYGANEHTDVKYEDCVAGGGLNPLSWDTDCDGLPDPWEAEFAGTYTASTNDVASASTDGWNNDGMDGTCDDYMKDYDQDGLPNWQEYLVGAMRCWRYDDTVSPWVSHQTAAVEVDGAKNKLTKNLDGEALTGDDLYAMLVNKSSAKFNRGFRNQHFDLGAYFSCADNAFEQGAWVEKLINYRCASAYGHFYMFKDGIDHDLAMEFDMAGDNRYTANVRDSSPFSKLSISGFGIWPRKYISCDPRLADTDYDGLDDYYEIFHGLNPLLGSDRRTSNDVAQPRDVVYEAYYDELNAPNPWSAEHNGWINNNKVVQLTRPDRPEQLKKVTDSVYDFFQFPWLAGLATADPDGDNIRNQIEGILPNVQAAATYLHTDPTPLWMTDTSYADSLTYRYYQVKDPAWASSRSVNYLEWKEATFTTESGAEYSLYDFPWLSVDANPDGSINGWFVNYDDAFNYWRISQDLFDFEENEGYDSDHDFLSDYEEGQGKTKNASDPQYHDDPLRRQAMWFGGEANPGFLQTPIPVTEQVPTSLASAEQRQNFLYFTVECWAKADQSNLTGDAVRTLVERAIWTGAANGADEKYLRKNFLLGIKGGKWYAMFDSTGTDKLKPVEILDGPAATTNWTHVAATYDGTTLKLYVNGILRSNHPTSIQPEHGEMALAINSAGEMAEEGTLSWGSAISILVGASATSYNGIIFDNQWVTRDVANVTDANPMGLDLEHKTTIADYGNFYAGYIDEVRIWDGARAGTDILSDYENRTRYDSALALENRAEVFAQWKTGARRSPAASTQLSAELMYHWSFDHLTGAVEARDVVPQPAGFSTDPSVTDAMAKWVRPDGWTNCWRLAIDESIRSTVYNDWAWVPWINDTIGHLPRYDGTTLDSVYWSADYAGTTAASQAGSGYLSFAFPRSAELPSLRRQMRYGVAKGGDNEADPIVNNSRWEFVKTLAGSNDTVSVSDSTYQNYVLSHRNRELTGFDLLPFGGAFPKRISKAEGGFWDAKSGENPIASDAWAQTGVDSNNDGLPDWWTQYALENYNASEDPTATITWDTTVIYKGAKMAAWRAYMNDLANGMHLESGMIVTEEPSLYDERDMDRDGLPDSWEEQWKLDTSVDNADDDPDNDGLSNYQEYLLSTVYPADYNLTNYPGVTIYDLSPNLDRTSDGQLVPDYFLRYSEVFADVTNSPSHFYLNQYFGGIVTDHDFMEDWWENLYDMTYTSAKKYDPLEDADGDGWSTWAECRSSLWGNSYTASLISKWTGSDSSQYVICRPQPIVGVKVTYNGVQKISGQQLVVRTMRHPKTKGETVSTDATFVVPPSLDGQTKFIGGFDGDTVLHGHLSPGLLNVNSIVFDCSRVSSDKVYTWNCDWYQANEPTGWGWDTDTSVNRTANYYRWSSCSRTHSGDFATYKAEFQKWPKIELEGGDFVWESFVETVPSTDLSSGTLLINGVTKFGWIDCTTGEYELDMTKFTGDGSVDEYVFRVTYTSRLGQEWPQTVYLSDTKELETTGLVGIGSGYVREGRNIIEAFIDLNADGVFTEGEPFGSVRNVMVGWHKVPVVTIELHDDSPIMPCVAIETKTASTSSDTSKEGEAEAVESTASQVSKKVSVKRIRINGLEDNEGRSLTKRTLATKTVVLADHAYLTEADVVQIGKPDLDWTWLAKDARNFGIDNIESVTYEVDEVRTLSDGTVSNVTLTTFLKEFSSSRAVPTVLSPVQEAPVYAASPTFTFSSADDSLTGYRLQIRNAESQTVVYDSGARILPGRTSGTAGQSVYTVTPPVFVGMEVFSGVTTNRAVFADGVNYQWRVALVNAKFNTVDETDYSDWSAGEFQMDVRNKNRYPNQPTGYGNIGLAVRYYGCADLVPSNIIVEAFENADFCGQPLAQVRLSGGKELLGSATDISKTNALLRGIAPGKCFFRAYYDQNGNGIRDSWETWGYANCVGQSVKAIYNPKDVTVTATAANWEPADTTDVRIYLEDCDVNQNEYPDSRDPKVSWPDPANEDTPHWNEPDPEEADPLIDTDGDGMPDSWENWNEGVTDPLIADGETLPEDEMDAMAYREETWQMVTLDDGSADGIRYLIEKDAFDSRDGLVASNYVFTTWYLYGPSTAGGQIYGVGTNVVITNAWQIKSAGDVTVALVHGQVYARSGYNPLTANAQALSKGTAVDTKPFTALDRYLVLRYFEAIGVTNAPAGYKNFEEYVLKSGSSSSVWNDWMLRPGTTDANNDFVADGWQLYVMYGDALKIGRRMEAGDRGNTSPWGRIAETTGKTPGGEGLSWRQEYNNGNMSTDPYCADTDGDSVSDYYVYHYGLTDPTGDPDGDGLSNYSEYLITEVFGFAKCDPNAYATKDLSTGEVVCDYYKKVGELYLGEMFQDHDRVSDAWERTYSTAANASVYDAARDDDGDGWSNYAEAKVGTNPSLAYSASVDTMLAEYPIPTIRAKVNYAGTLTGQMNFRAWSEKDDPEMLRTPSAAWASTTAKTNTVKYLGQNPGKAATYNVGTGLVKPGSVQIYFRDVRCEKVTLVDGEETAAVVSTDTPKWFPFIADDSVGSLWTVASTNSATANTTAPFVIGSVDYQTGTVTIDYSLLPEAYYDRYDNGDGSVSGKTQGIYYNAIKVNLASSFVRIEWTPTSAPTTGNETYYLNDSLAASSTCNGHIREGRNTFVVWCDREGGTEGAYDPGEPFGVVQGVDVGWAGASFSVTLTETSAVTPRFNIFAESGDNDRDTTFNESIANFVEDRIRNAAHPKGTNLVSATENLEKDRVHLRIVRWGINHLYAYALGVGFGDGSTADPIVVDRTYDKNGRAYLCEADFFQDGELDLDWSRLEGEILWNKDVRSGIGRYWIEEDGSINSDVNGTEISGVTNMTYLAVLEGGSGCEYWVRGSDDTNTVIKCLATTIERRFELVKHAPVAENVNAITYEARPTFAWSLPNEEAYAKKFGTSYTSFRLYLYNESGHEIYRSKVMRAPAQGADGVFRWTADVSAGDLVSAGGMFAATGNYKWRVAMFNAKFKPSSELGEEEASPAAAFSIAAGGQQEMNDHGCSAIDVAVRYAGPGAVCADSEKLTTLKGKVRAQAFASADFAGLPVSEAVVASGVTDFTSATANVRLLGLPQEGTYYIRAYIDSDGDRELDDWESWGAAAEPVVLAKTVTTAPVVGVWIEDSDTDGDWLPDAYEFVKYGSLATASENLKIQGANVMAGGATIFSRAAFNSATDRLAGISTYLEGATLTIFENGSWAKTVLDWGASDDITFADITEAVQKELSLREDTFRITSMTINGNVLTLKIDAEVSAEAIGSELLTKVYTVERTKTVKVRILKKKSLAQDGWDKVGDDLTITFGEGEQTATATILEDLPSAFYKVEIVE